jgi:hypothetical protein
MSDRRAGERGREEGVEVGCRPIGTAEGGIPQEKDRGGRRKREEEGEKARRGAHRWCGVLTRGHKEEGRKEKGKVCYIVCDQEKRRHLRTVTYSAGRPACGMNIASENQ